MAKTLSKHVSADYQWIALC